MIIKTVLSALFLSFITLSAFSQVDDPGDVQDIPFSGFEILAGVGFLFGIKKLNEAKKSKA